MTLNSKEQPGAQDEELQTTAERIEDTDSQVKLGTIESIRKMEKEKRIESGLPHRFSISSRGVFYTLDGMDDKPGIPMRICALLKVTAMSRDLASDNWGRVIEFCDADGIRHQWAVPMEMLSGDGTEMRRELLRQGLEIVPSAAAKMKLLEYIVGCSPKKRMRCVLQTGWIDDMFVMPDRTLGEGQEIILFQSENKVVCPYQQRGTLPQWRDAVARLCSGNSRLILSVSASFAGMILHHAGLESGGMHVVGSSSTGKSTAQLVAASIYGGPAFKQSWRATGNALEGTCAIHNDAALILDEIAEVDSRDIGNIVYMIGNGIGKGRAGRTGETKQRKTWRVMIISSGEIGLSQHMREGGKVARAGQEVRLIEVAADAGRGYGLFEELHGYKGGAELSDAIKEATQLYFGTPSIAFLEYLIKDLKAFRSAAKQAMNDFVKNNLPNDADGQASRVCSKFAVIAIAGEYATAAGITGWHKGEAISAAARCFSSWLNSRGGGGNQERSAILAGVKAFFELHGESRFTNIKDTVKRITTNRAGFRDTTTRGQEYYVLPEAYKREVCAGHDMRTVTKILTEAGWVEPGKDGKGSQSKRLPEMGKTRCYVFTSEMWKA